jgi:mannose-6-phosphate isomerase-like protein (cupin superfamily)
LSWLKVYNNLSEAYLCLAISNLIIPETITLVKSQARKVHGAYAIPMFYHSGFRSAWYQLDKGDKLNNEGDTNPFPQAFIIIEGQGYAKIGEIVQEVTAGKAYYIPPGSDHILWTEDESPLQLIYLAWGEKA